MGINTNVTQVTVSVIAEFVNDFMMFRMRLRLRRSQAKQGRPRSMSRVIIKNTDYETGLVRPIVHQMLDNIPAARLAPQTRVVVKPNLLAPAKPEKAIVTHPLIVRAVVEYLLEKGVRVQVSDSPAVESFRKIVREAGYAEALQGLDVVLKPFAESIKVDVGPPFGAIEVARDAVEADLVINLAKLKTHAQMFLTLGVKNIFGCIVGLRKPEWHMRAGVARRYFARLLVQIYEAVAPGYTIVDGILAMEGQGPGRSGSPRKLGLLVGGENAHAVDKTICTILGLDPHELLTYQQARELKVFNGEVHVQGNIRIVDDYCFPALNSLSLGPEPLNRFMRKYVIQKPAADNEKCKLCGECWKICPANVISHNIRGVQFNYDGCIRCYCCIEVCPHAAIQAKEPLLGKIRRKLVGP